MSSAILLTGSAKLYYTFAEVKDMRLSNPAQQLKERGYKDIIFVDPAGRHVATMESLITLLPEYFDPQTEQHFDRLITKVRDLSNIGAQVWQTSSWDAWREHGLFNFISVPTVFSIDQTIYIVRTDDAITASGTGEYLVSVDPLVLRTSDGVLLANADLFSHVFDVAESDYLLKLQSSALRKYPPISLDLVRAAGMDPDSIVFIDGKKLRGQTAGATAFRGRFLPDLDLVDFDFLVGEDEGRLFLSHLPYRVSSLRQAYASLCPLSKSELNLAYRQGEWWFYPADDEDIGDHGRPNGKYKRSSDVKVKPLSKSEKIKASINNSKYIGYPEHGYKSTYGGRLARITPDSEHFARELVVSPEGYVWVRGWVKHVRHDHEPLSLKGWHVVLHNGQVSAWSAPAAKRLSR